MIVAPLNCSNPNLANLSTYEFNRLVFNLLSRIATNAGDWDIFWKSLNCGNPFPIQNCSSLVPEHYDDIQLSYTDDDLTQVVYKLGTHLVATLNLSYTDSILTEVARA